MSFAPAALHFCSVHPMCIIRSINHAFLADGFIKTWPAAATFKFGVTFKESIAAGCTIVSAGFFKVFKLAGPCPFSSFLPGNIKDI